MTRRGEKQDSLEKDIEKGLKKFISADGLESIAATIVAALIDVQSQVLTIIFSDMTGTQTIKEFVTNLVICSILDSEGKKKKGQPLKTIIQGKISSGRIIIKFNTDFTRDDFRLAPDKTRISDIKTDDSVAFSTAESGCIRTIPIMENFLKHKKT
ncbi:MAG: hypothetical protein ACD_8C00114G0001 [uncultured bacterium]|nr:MAG: hypothetical protein ACD_8C00114G0001 [uncultured bacterium]